MRRYGIDVSSYNGRIDWRRVREAGCQEAIIKITRKDLRADSRFLQNWRDSGAAGITRGVYRYVYEATAVQARRAAEAVVRLLDGVQAPAGTVVWWDVEDNSIEPHLRKEREALRESIMAAKAVVELSGYGFGVYCGLWWYKSILREMDLPCPFWIARYPSRRAVAFGTAPEERYRPVIAGELWGWQYSATGQVSGIDHTTDLNVIYGSLRQEDPVPEGLLRWGSRGEGVCWVQRQLNRHGAELTVDGIFGPLTEAAVRAFQQANGLSVDGIVGPETKAALEG